jgi:predicted DNA-binding transcriptional regulator AlpA
MSARTALAQAAKLPASLSLIEAAALLGIGRTHAYNLEAAGQFPVPVLHLGRVIRVPTAPLLELLGLPTPAREPGEAEPHPGADGTDEEPPPGREEPS